MQKEVFMKVMTMEANSMWGNRRWITVSLAGIIIGGIVVVFTLYSLFMHQLDALLSF